MRKKKENRKNDPPEIVQMVIPAVSVMRISLLKTAIIGGLAGAVLFCLYFTVIYWVYGNPFLPDPKSLDFFIYMLTIVALLFYFRFRVNRGWMYFWQAFVISSGAVLLMATLCALFVYFFVEVLYPDVLGTYISYTLHQFNAENEANERHFGKDEYARLLQAIRQIRASNLGWYEWKIKMLIGLFISLIVSAVMRRSVGNQ